MGVDLSKGGRVSLTKEAPGLKNIKVGLGWDANASDTGSTFDLDASLFLLNKDGKVISDKHFVYFNEKVSPDGAVVHQGDNLTGEGDGDDEEILIDLSKIDPAVEKLAFVVTIHDATTKGQNFGQVSNALIRIVNQADNKELTKYELDEDYSAETGVMFGELYRKDSGWNFKAVGTGYNEGLDGFCRQYGVNV